MRRPDHLPAQQERRGKAHQLPAPPARSLLAPIVLVALVYATISIVALSVTSAAAPSARHAEPDTMLSAQGKEEWRRCSGRWEIAEGTARITEGATDGLMIHPAYRPAAAPLTINVKVSGSGATLLFGLDDSADATVGHFVRISGGALETGWIRGSSADQLTGRTMLSIPADGWTELVIEVDPQARSYTVALEGSPAIETQQLLCRGGWIGVRATSPSDSFRDLVITERPGAASARHGSKEPDLHRLRYVKAGAGNVVVHDPERNLLLALDLKGRLLKSVPPRFPVRTTTEVTVGSNTYRISDGLLIMSRSGDGKHGTDTLRTSIGRPAALVADRDGSVYVTDVGTPAVHQIDDRGEVLHTWRLGVLGGFLSPHGIDLLGAKEIVVADYDRVVILPKGYEEEGATLTPGARTITVEWALPSNVTPFAEVSEDGSSWRRIKGTAPAGTERTKVVLGDLEPATTYRVRFGPVVKTIPASAGVSRVMEASTLPHE